MTARSVLPRLLCTLIATAAIASVEPLQAQSVDQGDFNDGLGAAPSNGDSEFVPGLGMSLPTYSGVGCPQGTVNAVLSPDQRTLSVLFDAYVVRAGGASGVERARSGCQLDIPFSVPAGYQVQIVKLDYRGFVSIPPQARSTFGAGFRFLSINGTPTEARRVLRAKVFVGPRQENFALSSELRGPDWSPCGQSFVLAAESLLNVQTNRQGDEVVSTVDSLDAVQMPVRYSLRWKRCEGRSNPNRPPIPPRPPRGDRQWR